MSNNGPPLLLAGAEWNQVDYWAEYRAFYEQFRTHYFTTGAILPSSRTLALALARPFRSARGARRLLEIGPGTGAVTDTLVGLLQPGDTLDLVEINAAFVAILQARLEQLPRWRRVRRQVRVLHLPVQDVPGTQVYDFLISGLPLNNFPLTLVEDIFASYQRLGRPGGTLSYFEYVGIRVLKMVIVSAAERQRLAALDNFLTQRLQWQQFAAETVWWNAPPAVARHLRL